MLNNIQKLYFIYYYYHRNSENPEKKKRTEKTNHRYNFSEGFYRSEILPILF